jgi:hypothetical protein
MMSASAIAKTYLIYLYIYEMGGMGDIGEQKEKSFDVLFVCFFTPRKEFTTLQS